MLYANAKIDVKIGGYVNSYESLFESNETISW